MPSARSNRNEYATPVQSSELPSAHSPPAMISIALLAPGASRTSPRGRGHAPTHREGSTAHGEWCGCPQCLNRRPLVYRRARKMYRTKLLPQHALGVGAPLDRAGITDAALGEVEAALQLGEKRPGHDGHLRRLAPTLGAHSAASLPSPGSRLHRRRARSAENPPAGCGTTAPGLPVGSNAGGERQPAGVGWCATRRRARAVRFGHRRSPARDRRDVPAVAAPGRAPVGHLTREAD